MRIGLTQSFKWLFLVASCVSLMACDSATPVIRSLGLSTKNLNIYQSGQEVSSLSSNSAGEYVFDVECPAVMKSIEYSLTDSGPWTEISKIDCSTGRAQVTLLMTDAQTFIYLRTIGSWGMSPILKVPLALKVPFTLTGIPPAVTKQLTMSISVSGINLLAYKFSFGPSAIHQCSNEALYSSERAISLSITEADLVYGSQPYSLISDGSYTLCVLVKTDKGVWVATSSARAESWIKDTTPPVANLRTVNNGSGSINNPYLANNPAPSFVFAITGDLGSTVRLYSDNLCSSTKLLGTAPVDVNDSSDATGATKLGTVSFGSGLGQGNNNLYAQSTDAVGNSSTCASVINYNLDSIPPALGSFMSIPSSQIWQVGQVLTFKVAIGEPIVFNGAGAPELELRFGTSASYKTAWAQYDAANSTATLLAFNYTVQMNDDDNDGIVVASPLKIPASLVIADARGNPLNLVFTSPNTTGVKIDTQGPTVDMTTSVYPIDKWYKAGDNLDFRINFTESAVLSPLAPSNLKLTLAPCADAACTSFGAPISAPYFNGSGSATLAFRYVVASGDSYPFGFQVQSLSLAGGATLKDVNNNSAVLGFTAINKTGLTVDGIAPTLTSATLNANASYTQSSTVTLALAGASDTGGSNLDKVGISEVSCTSPLTYFNFSANLNYAITTNPTTSGSKTVYFVIQDVAGNTGSCQTKSIYLDTELPTISNLLLNGAAAGSTNQLNVTLAATIGDLGSGISGYNATQSNCTTAPASWVATTQSALNMSVPLSPSTDGLKSVVLWVQDKAGRTSCSTQSITLDTVAPSLLGLGLNQTNGASTSNSVISVNTVTVTDLSTQYSYCWADVIHLAAAPTNCATYSGPIPAANRPGNYTLLTEGFRDVYLFVKDFAGNVTSTMVVNLIFDKTAPAITGFSLGTPATSPGNIPRPTFKVAGLFQPGDALTLYDGDYCTNPLVSAVGAVTNGGGTVASNLAVTLTTDLTEANHTFSVKALDAAGNSACHNFPTPSYTYDVTPPKVSSISSADTGWKISGNTITFKVTFSESVNLTNIGSIKLPFIMGSATKQTAPCSWLATNTQLSCSYTVSAGDVDVNGISFSSAHTLAVTPAGALAASLTDAAGNPLNESLLDTVFAGLKVDTLAPDVSTLLISDTVISNSLTTTPPIMFEGSATDGESGIKDYRIQVMDKRTTITGSLLSESIMSALPPVNSSLTISGLSLADFTLPSSSNLYAIHVIVTDQAGNTATADSDGWRVMQFRPLSDPTGGVYSITGNDGESEFGQVLAVSDDGLRLLVGLPSNQTVRVYAKNALDALAPLSETWSQVGSDLSENVGARFGAALAVKTLTSGSDYLYAVGAPGDAGDSTASPPTNPIPGKVFVYRETVGSLNQTAIVSFVSQAGGSSGDDDLVGATVKFVGSQLIFGEPGRDAPGSTLDSGRISSAIWNNANSQFQGATQVINSPNANQQIGRTLCSLDVPGGNSTLWSNIDSTSPTTSAVQIGKLEYNSSTSQWAKNFTLQSPTGLTSPIKQIVATANSATEVLVAATDGGSVISISRNGGLNFTALNVQKPIENIALTKDTTGIFLVVNLGTAGVQIYKYDPLAPTTGHGFSLKQEAFVRGTDVAQTLWDFDWGSFFNINPVFAAPNLSGGAVVGLGSHLFIGKPPNPGNSGPNLGEILPLRLVSPQ